MVRFHCVDDNSVLLVLLTQFRTKLNVRALHLMVNGFTDIMKKSCPLRKSHIQAHL